MEKNNYVQIMIQSLKKKNQILDEIMELNQRQKEELENPSVDPEDFDKTVAEKAKLIEEVDTLDAGFQELFERVRDEFNEHRETYRAEIVQMQDYIRKLTEKSVEIQVQESHNKTLMQQKFTSIRKQVKEVRKSQKVVNQYYKNMMKTNFIEPQFTDKKK